MDAAIARMITDSSRRYSLKEVIAELDIDPNLLNT
jgi:hypothetical protein